MWDLASDRVLINDLRVPVDTIIDLSIGILSSSGIHILQTPPPGDVHVLSSGNYEREIEYIRCTFHSHRLNVK